MTLPLKYHSPAASTKTVITRPPTSADSSAPATPPRRPSKTLWWLIVSLRAAPFYIAGREKGSPRRRAGQSPSHRGTNARGLLGPRARQGGGSGRYNGHMQERRRVLAVSLSLALAALCPSAAAWAQIARVAGPAAAPGLGAAAAAPRR